MKSNYESFSSALEARSVAESWQPVEKWGRKGKRQREWGPEEKPGRVWASFCWNSLWRVFTGKLPEKTAETEVLVKGVLQETDTMSNIMSLKLNFFLAHHALMLGLTLVALSQIQQLPQGSGSRALITLAAFCQFLSLLNILLCLKRCQFYLLVFFFFSLFLNPVLFHHNPIWKLFVCHQGACNNWFTW